MIEIFEAIYERYALADASIDLRGLVSNFYFGQAPPGSPVPIVTYNIVGGAPEYTFDATLDRVTVQFSIWHDTYIGVMAIYDALTTAYQSATLPYDTGAHVVCRRENVLGPEFLEDVYQITTDYEIIHHLAAT